MTESESGETLGTSSSQSGTPASPRGTARHAILPMTFAEAFAEELRLVGARRDAVASGRVAESREGGDRRRLAAPESHLRILRRVLAMGASPATNRSGVPPLMNGSDLTGIALSGGGMRSASFCLGVLQAIDSLRDHREPHVLDAVDYLSTVSGGGYIGAAVASKLAEGDLSFPFDSRLDHEETPETQHLRNHSNFLAPKGARDLALSGVLVLRGLLVNAAIVGPVLLVLAALTAACNPTWDELSRPSLLGRDLASLPLPFIPQAGHFALTADAAICALALLLLSAPLTAVTYRFSTLAVRRTVSRALTAVVLLVPVVGVIEAQAFVLQGMYASPEVSGAAATAVTKAQDNAPGAQAALEWLGDLVPDLWKVLAPMTLALVALAQRLANVATAVVGEATWTGWFKRHASRLLIVAAAVLAPTMLWIAYLYLSLWAIRPSWSAATNPRAPDWLAGAVHAIGLQVSQDGWFARFGDLGTSYLVAAAGLGLYSLVLGPNSNSLHRLYRDRLSVAFLAKRPGSREGKAAADKRRLSGLKPRVDGRWEPAAFTAPLLIVNTAINLESSEELNKRGRNADVFTFTPLHVGSHATGYVDTAALEDVLGDLTIATAIATSGAAASANMGGSTVKLLTFSLSLLNIRLGYWLGNPGRMDDLRARGARFRANVGCYYFARESAGLLDEKDLNVYLTDGGHIENLGVYELLKRRCKVIVAVDAECDPEMTFPSLVRLEILARIDLGIHIDLPWRAISASTLSFSGRVDDAVAMGARHGPHAAIGRIDYGDDEPGVLVYLKSSLTGDENDYVLDYRRRHPAFPHESTIDQFYGEEQFEAYRALGFHVGRRCLDGSDETAIACATDEDWLRRVEEALGLLNLPTSSIARITASARAKDAPGDRDPDPAGAGGGEAEVRRDRDAGGEAR